jgi:hypothetical protein
MRAHGVTLFPDPAADGVIPKLSLEQLGVSTRRLEVAQSSCRHLLPGGGSPTRAQARGQALAFAQCMRAHGVAGFPDPAGDGGIPDPASHGLDQGAPRFQSANRACAANRPPYLPSNAAYDAWAAAHRS